MDRVSKFEYLKLLLVSLIFSFFLVIFWATFEIKTAIISLFLSWSFLILCIPLSHGKIILGVPFKLFTGKVFLYPEVFMWILAVILNIIVYINIPRIYFSTFINHLLLRVISTPWPYWLALFLCALATSYKFLIGAKNFKAKKIRHNIVRFTLIIISLTTFIYFSYNELIILLNIRA